MDHARGSRRYSTIWSPTTVTDGLPIRGKACAEAFRDSDFRNTMSTPLSRHEALSGSLLGAHPRAHASVEQIERKSALSEQLVVKCANVESNSELLHREIAKCLHLELAALIGESLAGIDDIAVDFNDNVLVCLRAVLLE